MNLSYLLKNSNFLKRGLVVSTDFQQNGRGYFSNKWESEVKKFTYFNFVRTKT